ncbi:MAG TPA: hypothetical protein VMW58_05445 [Anaerolineae bacterium]|nr:hypothetical protein [Anaerolineae bacterium]
MGRERWPRIQAQIVGMLGVEATGLDRSSYQLDNENTLVFRSSKAHSRGDRRDYWFGLQREKFEAYDSARFFLLLICGSAEHVLVLPGELLSGLLSDVTTASDDNWKFHILRDRDIYTMVLPGKPAADVSHYLNNYDLVLGGGESPIQAPEELLEQPKLQAEDIMSTQEEILTIDGLAGNTPHDRLADMIRQVGIWMGYDSVANYRVRADAPYRLDVAWLSEGAIHIAVEVQIGGNVTEAKDRLAFAKRFGARKCILVANPESVERIKAVFRYAEDIKHWVEIWSIERVYNLFLDGRTFFDNYTEFNKHQYREDIVEIV